MIELAASHRSDTEGRVNGIVDRPTAGRIAGWAIDRADPNSHVVVDIYFEGVLLGQVPATDYRKDLEKNGIGTGKYGFKFDLGTDIDADMSFAITAVARTQDAASASLRNTGRMAQSEDPAIRLAQRAYLKTCAVQQAMGQLSRKVEDQSESETTNQATANTLERIELVQARLETLLSACDTYQPAQQSAGLKWAVAIALVLGLTSFAVGLASLWVG